jgi:hypothetical protein
VELKKEVHIWKCSYTVLTNFIHVLEMHILVQDVLQNGLLRHMLYNYMHFTELAENKIHLLICTFTLCLIMGNKWHRPKLVRKC